MTGKKRILIIDDEQEIREILCECFAAFGFETMQAANGEHAAEFIELNGPPDVVMTDLIMPQKEGIETIIEIKKRYPQIKLIAMSGGGGYKNMDLLEAARKFGADVTVAKPLDMDELERIIASL